MSMRGLSELLFLNTEATKFHWRESVFLAFWISHDPFPKRYAFALPLFFPMGT